jgi:predicted ATPase/DNA-binding SARP family transcriptional activator
LADSAGGSETKLPRKMPNIEYDILGPLTVRRAPDGDPVRIAEQGRILLGRLLVAPGATVSWRSLAEAMWSGEARADDRNGVQVAVKNARKLLGDEGRDFRIIVNNGDGYRLVVEDLLWVDAERFTQLVTEAHRLVRTRPRAARVMLLEALASWSGRLLGEQADLEWARGHAAELDSLRDGAELDLGEVRLSLGEHVELERDLRRQIAEQPDDERRRAQLVRALDASGRAAEAGHEFREAVRHFGAVGDAMRRLGEQVGRGAKPRPTSTYLRGHVGGGPYGLLLWANLAPVERRPGGPGLGSASLRVSRLGGAPHPVRADRLVAVFDNPQAALRAAAAIASDRRLAAAIGLHAGSIVELGDRIGGAGPARCRLYAEAGHPGQVLVSAEARARIDPAVPLRDLGEQRLEDLLPGEPMFELTRADGTPAFPPPETLGRRPHNLPVQRTRFVGRASELRGIAALVTRGVHVTLVGVGGCGKTRLALQVAARCIGAFDDGAWFVELAELPRAAGPETVALAIVAQLRVRSLPGEPARAALVRHLSESAALLVLDNCEHVLAACTELVADVRAGCPDVCVLATSRQPLRTDGERVVEVPPMSPDSGTEAGGLGDAIELLLERAEPLPAADAASATSLDQAARICRALEGSPLGIELAAALVSKRGLSGVAVEVEAMVGGERGLGYLASDDPRRPPRQRTIQATIAWSHDLLSARERQVLHRLAVFRGPFGIAEAQAVVCGAGVITSEIAGVVASLIDRSLVASEPPLGGAPRARLGLPIRAFAQVQLDADELERLRERHAQAFCSLAAESAPALFGAGEQAALDRLEADHDNLRAALAWLIERADAQRALRLAGALWWLWFSRGHLREGSAWVQRILALDDQPTAARVRALRVGSHLAWWEGDYARTTAYNEALEDCARRLEDAWGLAWAPMGFGAVVLFPEPRRALPLFEDSRRRFRTLGRDWEAGYAVQLIGAAHWWVGDNAAAGTAYEEAAAIFERLEHGSVLASARRGAGLMAARCGRPERGAALCREALVFSEAIGDRAGSAQALNFLGAISRGEGELDASVARYADALSHAYAIGEFWATCWAIDGVAGVACAERQLPLAARLFACAEALGTRAGYHQPAHESLLRDNDVTTLRALLDERDFERAATEGALMPLAAAVAAALAFASRHA